MDESSSRLAVAMRRLLFVLILLMSLAYAYVEHFTDRVRPTGDELAMYVQGLTEFRNSALTTLVDASHQLSSYRAKVAPSLPESQRGIVEQLDSDVRVQVEALDEWVIPQMLWGVALHTRHHAVESESVDDFLREFPRNLVVLFFVPAAVVSLVFAGVVARDERVLVSSIAFVVVVSWVESHFQVLPIDPRLADLWHVGARILGVDRDYQVFGPSVRSNLLLLVAAVFVCRWRYNLVLAYLLIALLSWVHRSNAALLLFSIVGVDLLLRPQIFRDWRIIGAALFAFALWTIRAADFALGSAERHGLAIAFTTLVLVFAGVAYVARDRAVPKFIAATHEWVSRVPLVVSDIVAFPLGFLGASALYLTLLERLPSVYTFQTVNAFVRVPGIVRVPLYLGLCWLLVHHVARYYGRIRARMPWPTRLELATLLLVAIACFIRLDSARHELAASIPIWDSIAWLEPGAKQPIPLDDGMQRFRFFYAVLRAAVTDEPFAFDLPGEGLPLDNEAH